MILLDNVECDVNCNVPIDKVQTWLKRFVGDPKDGLCIGACDPFHAFDDYHESHRILEIDTDPQEVAVLLSRDEEVQKV